LIWFYDAYKNNIREVLALEYNFRPKWLVYKWIPITGKIDKIELISWFHSLDSLWWWVWQQMAFFKESVAIIDYKTGKIKSLGEIKWIDKQWNKKAWEWKYFRQLMFYKLLCEEDSEFFSRYDIGSLALDFVEWKDGEYQYREVSYTLEEYEYFKNELVEAREKISNIDFWKDVLR
jgi:hypothetical protein